MRRCTDNPCSKPFRSAGFIFSGMSPHQRHHFHHGLRWWIRQKRQRIFRQMEVNHKVLMILIGIAALVVTGVKVSA